MITTPTHNNLVEDVVAVTRPKPRPAKKLRRSGVARRVSNERILALRAAGNKPADVARFVTEADPWLHTIRRWYLRYDDLDADDVVAESRAALLSALGDWDPALGAPFDTHAGWRVRRELGKLLSASRIVRGQRAHRFKSLPTEPDDEDHGRELSSIDATPEQQLERRQAVATLVRSLDFVPDGVDAVALAERAVDLGVSATWLRQRLREYSTPVVKPKRGGVDSGVRLLAHTLGNP